MAIRKKIKRDLRRINKTMGKETISLLFHKRTKVDGMNKVVWNLIAGFKLLGIPYIENKISRYTGCLQGGVPGYDNLPRETLMGVSLMEIPTDQKNIWQRYNHFVTCSDWVKKKYETFKETSGKKISVWASGVETDRFNDNGKKIQYDCFIYYKDVTRQVSENDLKQLQIFLARKKLSVKVLRYGQYTEPELIEACKTCRFGIMLTGTESQGIALLEILSMGTPLYVLDITQYRHRKTGYIFNGASSAPFFCDNRCGIKHKDITYIDVFLNNIPTYSPREYVVENFTLEKCAQRYYDIITGVTK